MLLRKVFLGTFILFVSNLQATGEEPEYAFGRPTLMASKAHEVLSVLDKKQGDGDILFWSPYKPRLPYKKNDKLIEDLWGDRDQLKDFLRVKMTLSAKESILILGARS